MHYPRFYMIMIAFPIKFAAKIQQFTELYKYFNKKNEEK